MARPRITITVAPQVSAHIDTLLATGLFGLNRAQLVERLMCDRLIELANEGWIKVRRPGKGSR